MIAFLPIRDRAMVQTLAQKEGVSASFGYAVFEKETPVAYVLYNVNEQEGVLVCIGGTYDDLTAEVSFAPCFPVYMTQIFRVPAFWTVFRIGLPARLVYKRRHTDNRIHTGCFVSLWMCKMSVKWIKSYCKRFLNVL